MSRIRNARRTAKANRRDRQVLHPLERRILLTQVWFGASRSYPARVASTLPAITTADFDGNGKPDVASVNNADSPTSSFDVFLNDGSGDLLPRVSYATVIIPRGIVAADFNGDGRPDIATSGSPGMRVHINNGDGTFTAGTSYTVNPNGASQQCIKAADINADGAMDIVLAYSTSVQVFLNNGDGTFAPRIETLVPNAQRLTVDDFNGDGNLDLATTYYASDQATFAVLMGNGDGTFAAPVQYAGHVWTHTIVSADFNKDGKADLAMTYGVPSRLSVFLNNGDGTFGAKTDYVISGAGSIVVGDFNNDGSPDLATTAASGSTNVQLFENNGNGTFKAAVNYPVVSSPFSSISSALAAADFDQDGRLDFALSGSDSSFTGRVWTLRNLGVVATAPKVSMPVTTFATLIADFDGDGLNDLALLKAGNLLGVQRNLGGGVFAGPVDYPTASGSTLLATGDLNHDGHADLVIGGTNGVSVLLNAGDGTFGARTDSSAGAVTSIAVKDVNGDDAADVAVIASIPRVLLSDGAGQLLPPTDYSWTHGEVAVALADFNGDGIADLATYADFWGTVNVRLNLGNGTFGAVTSFNVTSSQVHGFLTDDFNGDGKMDLATVTSFSFIVLLNNETPGGAASFAPAVEYSPSGGFFPVAATSADLNGDGRPDLVFALSSSTSKTFLNAGNGTFGPGPDLTPLNFPTTLTSGDLNGDGKPDLVFGYSNVINTDVILNVSPWIYPRVTDVFVRGTAWSNGLLNRLAAVGRGDKDHGYRIPPWAMQLDTLPWGNVNQVSIRFNRDVTVTQASLAIAGVNGAANGAAYEITDFVYDPSTHTATWTLAAPVDNDALQLSLASTGVDAVRDVAGNTLDGEWGNGPAAVSGNGVAGGGFTFGLRVLPGDSNNDSVVNFSDFVALSNHFGQQNSGPQGGDFDGDGITTFSDFVILSNHFGNIAAVLPAASPALLVAPATAIAPLQSPVAPTTAPTNPAELSPSAKKPKPAKKALPKTSAASARRATTLATLWKAARIQAQRRLAWFAAITAGARH